MPLAKTAQSQGQPIPAPIHAELPTQFTSQIDNVPLEVFRFFNIDPFGKNHDAYTSKQLREIYGWAKEEGKNIGDALFKIRAIERKIGAPQVGEMRHIKVYNYIKIAKVTQELEAERNRQYEYARMKREARINQVREQKQKELRELERQKNSELNSIRKQYDKSIKPIQKIRAAFEAGGGQ